MSSTPPASPPSKRVKLDSALNKAPISSLTNDDLPSASSKSDTTDKESEHEFSCSICLQNIVDRTVIPTCSHDFCFECIMVWSEQSRRCPLCSQSLGEYLIHNIRSKYDFRKHYLAPLRTASEIGAVSAEIVRQRRTVRSRELERRLRKEREEKDRLTRSVERRRWIYENDLYAKHIASNSHTRYRPYPTPAQFTASPELISRATTFLRRELQIWDDLDVEFLTTFIISMMKSIDIRSESAVKLLAEFLDMDTPYVEGGRHINAEHFAHEVYSYLRSPFRDIFVYDDVVQYDVTAPPERSRGRTTSRSPSRSRRHLRHRSLSHDAESESSDRARSWSPSGRQYPSLRVNHAGPSSRHQSRSEERDTNQGEPPHQYIHPPRRPSSVADAINGIFRAEAAQEKEREKGETFSEVPKSPDEASPLRSPPAEVMLIATGSDQVKSRSPQGPSSELRIKKPPKHRSLLESVHSHLALGSRVRDTAVESQSKATSQQLNGQRHPKDSPVVLSMSPTLLKQSSGSTMPADRGPELDTLTSPESTANRHQDLPAADNRMGPKHTRLTPPESTAHPHAFISKIDISKNLRPLFRSTARSSTLLPSLRGQEYGHPSTKTLGTTPAADFDTSDALVEHVTEFHLPSISGSGTHMALRGIPIDERPPIAAGSDDKSHPHFMSDTRTKLLRRLQQEKTLAESDIPTCRSPESGVRDDRTFRTANNDSQSASVTTARTIDTSESDPLLIETKLRKRAQLQIRLAIEKRCNGV